MTGWDVLDALIKAFPYLAAAALPVAAWVVFIIGFSNHGLNFIKYGFKQMALDRSLEKRFNGLEANIDGLRRELRTEIDGLRRDLGTEISGLRRGLGTGIGGLRNELGTIKANRIGRLKNFLAELASILQDKK